MPFWEIPALLPLSLVQELFGFLIGLKTKIRFGVPVANTCNDSPNQLSIVWQFSILHFTAKEITQDSAEILVSRIRHKRTRVGDHADESGKQSEV